MKTATDPNDKNLGILFRTPLVRAVARGEQPKTQTRRTDRRWLKVKEGHRLHIRETWAAPKKYYHLSPLNLPIMTKLYYATGHEIIQSNDEDLNGERGKWRPGIHMPKIFRRYDLVATKDAFVQRLHDMTDEDALAEGIFDFDPHAEQYRYGMKEWSPPLYRPTAKEAFKSLWDSIHKDNAPWESNPELVVLTFKRL